MILTPIEILIILLELFGLGITIYLIVKNFEKKAPVCLIGHDCDLVLQSKYSKFFGIKMEVWGFAYYIFMLALFGSKFFLVEYAEIITIVFGILVTSGVFVSVILTYIQTRILKSLCSWCLLAAFSNTALFFAMMYYIST